MKKKTNETSVEIKHERRDKIISGVSYVIADLLGVDVRVIRLLFLLSFAFLAGMPIYFALSLFMKKKK